MSILARNTRRDGGDASALANVGTITRAQPRAPAARAHADRLRHRAARPLRSSFTYGFGGAIHPPSVAHYIDYLLPGIFVLSIGFGASQTGVAVAEDLANGMIDRFRSLPIASGAVLTGRIAADAIRNLLVIGVIIGVGHHPRLHQLHLRSGNHHARLAPGLRQDQSHHRHRRRAPRPLPRRSHRNTLHRSERLDRRDPGRHDAPRHHPLPPDDRHVTSSTRHQTRAPCASQRARAQVHGRDQSHPRSPLRVLRTDNGARSRDRGTSAWHARERAG
jgi:hypothetical protein